MAGFSFALVPLYNVFCKVTGINGKTANQVAQQVDTTVDQSRWVTIEFYTTRNNGLPWEFPS